MDDACWDFLSDSRVVTAAEMASRKACRLFENAEFGDCLQDAMVYLATHSGTIERLDGKHSSDEAFVKDLAQYVFSNGLRDGLVRESNQLGMTVYRDAKE